MGTAQRVSHGFHRLAVFVGAIPLFAGLVMSAVVLLDSSAWREHRGLVCANNYIVRERLLLSDEEMKGMKPWEVPWQMYIRPTAGETFANFSYNKNWQIQLSQIGCSHNAYDTVSYGDARNPPPDFPWSKVLRLPLIFLAKTLGVSLALYGLVRAIGWVIGCFAAS